MGKHIKDFLPSFFAKEDDWKMSLIKEWPTIIGNLKDKVMLEKIEHTTIILGVTHPAWIQELSFLKPILLKTINDHLPKPYIETIRLKVSSPVKKKSRSGLPSHLENLTPYTPSLSELQALKRIKDKELQSALHLFLQRCKQL